MQIGVDMWIFEIEYIKTQRNWMQNTVDLWSFVYISYKSKSIRSAKSCGFVDFVKYENIKIKVQKVKGTVHKTLKICGFSIYTLSIFEIQYIKTVKLTETGCRTQGIFLC